jgi:23S rRNA pseudouridine955/2504/2580 synthase
MNHIGLIPTYMVPCCAASSENVRVVRKSRKRAQVAPYSHLAAFGNSLHGVWEKRLMGHREFPITEADSGTRLESFLRNRLGLARQAALKALRKGWARVDGKRAKGSRRLAKGEVVKITNYGLPLPAIDSPRDEGPPSAPEDWVTQARAGIRLEDDDLVVALKPSGRAFHKGSGHEYGWNDAVGAAVGARLTPVGRLDRDTSGLLVLARRQPATRTLFQALREGSLARTYQALASGAVKDSEGTIDQPLRSGGATGQERMRADPQGQPAKTHYRVLERHPKTTLLELELGTGRKHQIRAHLHSIGHPVLGDPRYQTPASAALARLLGLERLFLHAGTLRLLHPTSGEAISFEEPLPAALARALRNAK